ncbi:MAG: FumA C-terminus/TtdB family hydratase beta subunit [Planctomycetota bacterium]|jgi:fumarate hydratase class I
MATRIDLPTSEEQIRTLEVGDEVSLFGKIVTARDMAHKFMVEQRPDWLRPLLENTIIYHCGPVMRKKGKKWQAVAAGPTTSAREEPYQGTVIEEYKVRAVIGKGGMGPKTLSALKEHGAVYLHAVGGLASVLAQAVKSVPAVHMLEEFGAPEAFWVFDVEGFPAVVTMDSHGKSLHAKIKRASKKAASRLIHGT